jgi:hypothetical protein
MIVRGAAPVRHRDPIDRIVGPLPRGRDTGTGDEAGTA